jgi:hypothetical protein
MTVPVSLDLTTTLAELEAKRDALTEAIRLIRFVSSGAPLARAPERVSDSRATAPAPTRDGTTLPEMALRCLSESLAEPQTAVQLADKLGLPAESRPSLTSALHRLKQRGQVIRLPDGWALNRESNETQQEDSKA